MEDWREIIKLVQDQPAPQPVFDPLDVAWGEFERACYCIEMHHRCLSFPVCPVVCVWREEALGRFNAISRVRAAQRKRLPPMSDNSWRVMHHEASGLPPRRRPTIAEYDNRRDRTAYAGKYGVYRLFDMG